MLGIIFSFLASLFFPGIITRVKSITAGRKGPSLLQPMLDIVKLLRKGNVYSTTTSFIFKLSPVIYFTSVFSVLFLIPFGSNPGIISFDGDFILFAYILCLGKFMMIIGALDTGSCFEGMGASREALYSMLVESAFFIIMASFAMLSGYTSFSQIFNSMYFESYLALFAGVLATYTIFQVAMVENSRLPYDDPRTHLELTMVHEVMILDYSGFELALIQYTSALKFVVFGSIISNFFITPVMPFVLQAAIFMSVQIFMAIAVGIAESFNARNKLRNNNKAIIILTPVALLVFFSVLLMLNKQF